MKIKKSFMERAIQLAKNGLGNVSPNPMVGCVIEHKGRILSEGWHYKYGEAHAEVIAINKIKNCFLLLESTLYVTLEPCVHIGNTPPCVDLIIKNNIPRVVIGVQDPYNKVKGRGIDKLRKSGILVINNYLENECKILNKRFFTFYKKNRPFIILKWAQNNDGFITSQEKKKIWISNIFSRQLNHKWRAEEDSILIGKRTVLIDNPKLNIRKWYGNNPIRILLDKNLNIPNNYFVLDNSQRTIIFNEIHKKKNNNIEYIKINFNKDMLFYVLKHLYNRKIQSIIIEGGKKILESFIKENLWDECRIFISKIFIKSGIKAPNINGSFYKEIIINDIDKLIIKHY
ncbi:bifunctional diaminohydroxyphosphoribosylaminopyrimidine deaminase/5-amino-6-(5-phosphoribosylamino)uracil reductase RibD [Blattabacterium cuenoti]|uniref:bifunctional diaminohydroxyphosphoribosylaminopyrimidine deaminase/5-amino-6-(5-phosphoribosylamino)uracil reductase RibD n=1 Tax=Blattabacterium cuenoti TaxID=1653831 RepID=UPI00163CA880|nr:bifunctional diaminohydroxyphosphoribosylaminopyrimidine deaminase/5-amino-6-(5-phosphoribosylamino)uracil reductase RibD [Blattabacterium cuenoti]